MKKTISTLILATSFIVAGNASYKVEKSILKNGKGITKTIIIGSSKAPFGLNRPKVKISLHKQSANSGIDKNIQKATVTKTLESVAVSSWAFGCTPTSGAMIAGYYDRHGFSNIYTGPANGGLMPENNEEFWPDNAAYEEGVHQNPLSASLQDLDGHSGYGHVDDYWVAYNNNDTDPYVIADRQAHAADSIADYMKTNMHGYENEDGATAVYGWTNSGDPMTAEDMEEGNIEDTDGIYGFKLFMESRGYVVTELYTQSVDARVTSGGFSFNDYKAEIDHGYPVMIHLTGHTIIGVGYDTTDGINTVYLYDTWDFDLHSMVWGEQYGEGSGAMDHESVSIIHIVDTDVPTANAGVDQTVTEGESVTLNASASSDSDGSIVSYSWKEGSVTLSTASSFTKADFSVGTHTITLTVTDNKGATDSDTVVIMVNTEATSGGGGGCTYNPNSTGFDMMILLMLLASVSYPLRRKLLR